MLVPGAGCWVQLCAEARTIFVAGRWTEKDFAGELVERRRVRVQGNDLLYDPKVCTPNATMLLR